MNKNSYRRSFIVLISISLLFQIKSQDIIILKNGDEIKSKVTEITPEFIKYYKFENIEGPIYSSKKSDVFMIKYQNGSKDVFNENNTNTQITDNANQVEQIAKEYMEKQISNESKGACKLIAFNKVNGIQNEIFGQKIYTLEYKLKIELLRDFWKESKDKWLGGEWYWTNFSVLDKKGDIYAETWTNNFQLFTAGSSVEITGEIKFESTDNGWRVSGISMFSKGYENKTAKVYKSIIKPSDANNKVVPSDTIRDNFIGNFDSVGNKTGFGKMVYANGNVYEGEWKNNLKNGQGKQSYKDGSSYEGEWKDNKIEGYGTIIWANGKKYVGNLVNNQMHGKGILYDSNGNKEYDGELLYGQFNGFGINTFSDSEGTYRYEGYWTNGKWNGNGTFTDNKSGVISTCVCEFKNGGIFNGRFITLYPDQPGVQWVINYKDGKKGKEKEEILIEE